MPMTDAESDSADSCWSWSSETGTECGGWEQAAARGQSVCLHAAGAEGGEDEEMGGAPLAARAVFTADKWPLARKREPLPEAARAAKALSRGRGEEEQVEPGHDRGRSRSPRLAGSAVARPEETLIIFDWDDTLLPSTWLQQQGLRLDGEAPTQVQASQLGGAARRAARTLRAAMRLGMVVVVTNAELGWVELSCRRFLPTLTPLLEGVKIRSARWAFERQGVTSPLGWKRMAFHEELRGFCEGAAPGRRLTHVVSLGDSVHEREAVLRAAEDFAGCWGKSVKFLERPALEVFNRQHRFLMRCLGPIVRHNGKLDLCLRYDDHYRS